MPWRRIACYILGHASEPPQILDLADSESGEVVVFAVRCARCGHEVLGTVTHEIFTREQRPKGPWDVRRCLLCGEDCVASADPELLPEDAVCVGCLEDWEYIKRRSG